MASLDHKKVYGDEPPEIVMFIDPLLQPTQLLLFVITAVVAIAAIGSVVVTDNSDEAQPLASLTVTV